MGKIFLPRVGIIVGMNETLYLSYPKRLLPLAQILTKELSKRGYHAEKAPQEPLDGSLVLLLLDMESKEEEIFASAPWLKKQFDYSSLKALRLMPFLFYRSSLGCVDEQVEENLGETLEAVISGEFKPYGFDLDASDPLAEFPSVLETYEE